MNGGPLSSLIKQHINSPWAHAPLAIIAVKKFWRAKECVSFATSSLSIHEQSTVVPILERFYQWLHE